MCEKCEELEDDGIFDREVRVTLTVGEVAVLMTAAGLAASAGIGQAATALDKLMEAVKADREAFQEGEWPEEVTEVEQ